MLRAVDDAAEAVEAYARRRLDLLYSCPGLGFIVWGKAEPHQLQLRVAAQPPMRLATEWLPDWSVAEGRVLLYAVDAQVGPDKKPATAYVRTYSDLRYLLHAYRVEGGKDIRCG